MRPMHTIRRGVRAALILGPALLLAGALVPSGAAAAGPITSPACSAVGTTVTCNLWAKTGTLSLPGGGSVTFWGYATTAADPPTIPGPAIVANQGDSVTVNLTNLLPASTAIVFDGQAMVPDTTGAAALVGTKSYTFTASTPGTYGYGAGMIPGTAYQAALGLAGALVVHPVGAPGQAYGDAATAFSDEALVVLGEVDPLLNGAADPSTFDMRNFAPTYYLMNGAAYPATAPITTTPGNQLLLRYVNAGIRPHSIGVLGLHQVVLGLGGNRLPQSRTMVAETLGPGATADVLVSVPATPTTPSRYPLYDASMVLSNNGATGFGGMMTFIDASGTPGTGDTQGPLTSGITVVPGNPIVTINATVSDVSTGGSNVTAAEARIDSVGAAPIAMTGTFGSPTASVSVAIDTTPLSSGTHTVYVRGIDSAANTGPNAFTTFTIDRDGPAVSGIILTPSVTNSAAVAVSATADDRPTGNANISAAEYFIDAVGADGSGTALAVSAAQPVASITGSIAAGIVAGLAPGTHTIYFHALDANGNWGSAAAATATLTIDRTGPATSGASVNPTPNNGTVGVNSTNPVVRVTATFTDAAGTVATGEVFIDTVGADGSGVPFVPSDGQFNTAVETGTADIPLSTIIQLAPGNHTLSVHGKDAAGNWGAFATTVLVIDKAGPTSSGVSLTPPASNNSAVTVAANASDVATGNANISGGEAFLDAVGVSGTGFAMSAAAAAPATSISGTIPGAAIAALTPGNHTVYVHARDVAGNWGPTATGTLLVDRTAPTIAGITLTPASVPAGTASVTLALTGTADPLVGGLASGVAGGEWWFGTTNPAAGGGQAFAGLSTSIATSCLAPGTYTVRARVRDVAGNWSTGTSGVRSATLTVSGPAGAGIFCDGFEAPNILPGTWSSRSTTSAARLSVTAAAALTGSWGLQAQGNNTNYVQYNFGSAANPAAAAYDARFYFRPNGNTSTGKDILSAASSNTFGTVRFRVRYRLNAGQTQVQIQVGTGNANTTWTTVSSTSSNVIEVVWQSGSTLTLTVNGVLSQTLAAPAGSIGAVRLGSVTTTGNATALSFDAFASKRTASPLFGP